MTAEELILRITGDSEGGKKALESLTGSVESTLDSLKKATIEGLGPMGIEAAALATALVGLGVAAFELGQRATEVGAQIEKIAMTANSSAPAIAQLGFAMEATGGSFDQLNTMMFMFEQRMVNSSTKVDAGLKMIGLSLEQINQMSADQAILAISDAFRHSGEDVNRAAAAMDIFGRQGRVMLPQLMQDLSGLADKAKEVASWTDEDAKAAHEFEIASKTSAATAAATWVEFGKEFSGMSNSLVLGWDRMKLAVANVTLTLGDLVKGTYDVGTGFTALVVGEFSGWLTDIMGKLPEVAKGLKGLKDGSGLAAAGLKEYQDRATEGVPVVMSLSDAYDLLNGGINADIYNTKKAEEEAKRITAELKPWNDALREIDSAGTSWQDTLHRINPAVADWSTQLLKAGVALHTVELNQGLTATEGHALEQQIKFLESAATATTKAFGTQGTVLMGLLKPAYSTAHEYVTGLTDDQTALSAEVLDFGLFKAPETIDAMGRWDNSTQAMRDQLKHLRDESHDSLADVSQMFIQMGQAAGGSMSAVVGGIGQIIVALNALKHSGQKSDGAGGWVDMSDAEQAASTRGKVSAGVAGGIGLGMNADTTQGFNHSMITGLGMDSAGGIAQTVALGVATMGISVGVQAAVAALKYLFRDRTLEDIARDAGKDFGTNFSDETTKSIQKYIKSGFSFQAAELVNLSGIIKDAGGLTDKNLPQMTARLHDVFSMIETHQMTIAQSASVIDDNWQAFVAAGTDGNGRLSKSLRDIITLNERFGTQSKEIAAYLQGQGKNAMAGFSAVMAATGQAANATKEDLSDLGVQAVTTFAAAVAAGMPMTEALHQIAPALSTLRENYERLGLDVDDVALKNLLMQSTIVEGNPALMSAIGGLSQEMIALDNMGLLNVDTFEAMERTGFRMYTRLQGEVAKVGGSTKDALIPMQKYLHDAADEAEKLGIPLDDNDQMLIAQSKDLGIWKDKGKDATQQLTDGVLTLNDTMKQFLDYLSKIGPVPAPWANWGTPPAAPSTPGGPPPDDGGGQALGGRYHVTRPTMFLAGEAGPEDAFFSGANKRFSGMSGVVVNLHVEGSVMTERDLIETMRQGIARAQQLQRY